MTTAVFNVQVLDRQKDTKKKRGQIWRGGHSKREREGEEKEVVKNVDW